MTTQLSIALREFSIITRISFWLPSKSSVKLQCWACTPRAHKSQKTTFSRDTIFSLPQRLVDCLPFLLRSFTDGLQTFWKQILLERLCRQPCCGRVPPIDTVREIGEERSRLECHARNIYLS